MGEATCTTEVSGTTTQAVGHENLLYIKALSALENGALYRL